MSLTTAKIDTLRARNDALQLAAGSDREETELSGSEIRRLERHRESRAELEELASVEPQRETYGLELWHEHYVCLSEIETHGANPLSGQELRQALWDALPNSRFKRFQELFSHPHQLIVPRVILAEDGSIREVSKQALNRCSLQGCLVAADLVDDNFAAATGIAHFTENDQRRPAERLRTKVRGNTIAELKYLFEAATSLNEDTVDQRVLAIDSPGDPLHGSLFYTRQPGTTSDTVPSENGQVKMRRLSIQFFADAHSVFRRTLHVDTGYRNENSVIAAINSDLRQLVRTVAREWHADSPETTKVTLQQRASETVAEHDPALEHATGPFKQTAHGLLASSNALLDSLGRRNPMASVAKLSKADRQLMERLQDMLPKGRSNTQDSALIARHIAASERVFEQFRLAVEENAASLETTAAGRLALFSESRLSQKQIESNAAGLMVHLGVHPEDFEVIRLQPYVPFADVIEDRLIDLACALRSRDLQEAQQALVGAYLTWKFYDVHVAFETIKADIREGAALPISRIREFTENLTESFGQQRVLPEVVIGSYEEPLMEMQRDLRVITDRLAHYEQQDVDVTEQTEMYQRLKEYLKTFDIPGIVSALC